MQLQSLFQIFKRLFFAFPLTRYVDLQALGDEPIALSPDGSCKGTFHSLILPQSRSRLARSGLPSSPLAFRMSKWPQAKRGWFMPPLDNDYGLR